MKKLLTVLTVYMILFMAMPANTNAATPGNAKALCLTTASTEAPPLIVADVSTGTKNLNLTEHYAVNTATTTKTENLAATDIGIAYNANTTGYNSSGQIQNSTGWDNKDVGATGWGDQPNTTGWTKAKAKGAIAISTSSVNNRLSAANNTTAKSKVERPGYAYSLINTTVTATKNENGTITTITANNSSHPDGCSCTACAGVNAVSGNSTVFNIRI